MSDKTEQEMVWKVYLSGPMTGLPEMNYPAFMEAANRLRACGFEIYNPAEWEQHNNNGVFNLNIAFADYCTYIARVADGVVTLPGWENSPGATAEVALARAVRKPCISVAEAMSLGPEGWHG